MRNVLLVAAAALLVVVNYFVWTAERANAQEEAAPYSVALLDLKHVDTGEILKVVAFNGKFDVGATALVEKALVENEDYRTIVFNSEGGLGYEGFTMGNVMSRYGVKTWVPAGRQCMSACAIAFIGGSDYKISGVLGFHNAWNNLEVFGEDGVDQNELNQIYRNGQFLGTQSTYYLLVNGFSIDLQFSIASRTDPANFVIFKSENELNKFYVRNDGEGPDEFANYVTETGGNIVVENGSTIYPYLIKQIEDLQENGGSWNVTNVQQVFLEEVSNEE